jgi:hypothetical protein
LFNGGVWLSIQKEKASKSTGLRGAGICQSVGADLSLVVLHCTTSLVPSSDLACIKLSRIVTIGFGVLALVLKQCATIGIVILSHRHASLRLAGRRSGE